MKRICPGSWPARVARPKGESFLSPHPPPPVAVRKTPAPTHEWPIVGVRGVQLDAPSWHCPTVDRSY